MANRVKVEIDPSLDCDILIRCREDTPTVGRLRQLAERGTPHAPDMVFSLCGTEYLVPVAELLFLETAGDKTAVHTAGRMYYSPKPLCVLQSELDGSFCRVSRSCILNLRRITSLRRELTGIAEVHFGGTDKTVFVSRMYYKPFRERLEEVRLGRLPSPPSPQEPKEI